MLNYVKLNIFIVKCNKNIIYVSSSPYWTYDNCSKYAETDSNYVAKGTYSNACTKVFILLSVI